MSAMDLLGVVTTLWFLFVVVPEWREHRRKMRNLAFLIEIAAQVEREKAEAVEHE